MTPSGPRLVHANSVPLCIETFGDPESPSLLLIAGAAMSMDWWEDELCERLAAGPRQVIRYDLRDTGQSITYEPGAPQYGGRDLVEDAVGILDALAIRRAHVAGISMGGGIAQQLALDHPERVASLTLLSTSAGGSRLPGPSERLVRHLAHPPRQPSWWDREAVLEYVVEDARRYGGAFFDEDRVRTLAGRVVDRTAGIASTLTNHSLIHDDGEPLRPRLHEITVPTLVLHGTEDPLFPIAHGEALVAEIPDARLLLLEGVGHEVPPREVWDQVVPAILEHTAER